MMCARVLTSPHHRNKHTKTKPPKTQSKTKAGALAKYGHDLTAAARDGKLDPVIGRAAETRRLIDVLCRRTKNSAVLVGEPGVGKTAVVHGLAQRMADGDVPDGLRGGRVVALDMGLLMAGERKGGGVGEIKGAAEGG